MTNPSPPDWRGLCEELADKLSSCWPSTFDPPDCLNRARTALAADLLEQRQAAPVPVASDTRYEFSVFDEDYTEQAGGSAPTYAQALSEGEHYLAQYQQDGPHTLEVRRVENLNPDAFPVPDDAPVPLLPEGAQVIEPTNHTILVPVPVPVPVSERLPGPEDCISNPRNGQGEWCWGWVQHDPLPYSGRWRMMRREWVADDAVAWLPATALPLPSGEVQP